MPKPKNTAHASITVKSDNPPPYGRTNCQILLTSTTTTYQIYIKTVTNDKRVWLKLETAL